MATKVRSTNEWFQSVLDRRMSVPARQKAAARHARAKLVEAQRRNQQALGEVPPHKTFVDGRAGASLETVNPEHGEIVFRFALTGEVLGWILQTLIERSPRLSGAYVAGHRLFADGREVDFGGPMPQASEFSFTNSVPYSRRLEIGKTKSGRDFLVSVPNRIYERTAQDARARFGNIAKISFTFRGIVGGAQINQGKAASSGQPWWMGGGAARAATGASEIDVGRRHGRTAHNKSNVRYPTIVVVPN